jgi:RHS repeat-associated protein
LIDDAYSYDRVTNITRIDDLRDAAQILSGDPRRNTRIFEYDDLYRLRRVRFSFHAPGEPDGDDGGVLYRYDRIGNMLEKQSPNDPVQPPGSGSTDLGDLAYGGPLGTWNRIGRSAAEPGPHALTSCSSGGAYRYDGNGNMLEIDGLMCTWDFRNRLVHVEDDSMTAEYVYDFDDRRIVKKVWAKANDGSTAAAPDSSVVFVNRYFEVREFEQPVKYVWAGGMRVARISGTLDRSADRVQRISLRAGWNQFALAVDAPDAAEQLGVGTDPRVVSAHKWDVGSGKYVPVGISDPLPSSSIIWLNASEPFTLALVGAYTDPAGRALEAGWQMFPSAALEAAPIDDLLATRPAAVWMYDAGVGSWKGWFPDPLGFLSELPIYLSPGAVLVLDIPSPQIYEPKEAGERIQYYHPDHLGSTTVVTDASGSVLSRECYLPFGGTRFASTGGSPGREFGYGGKEKDRESGLYYYGARYYNPKLCRFITPDPIGRMDVLTGFPQSANLYALASNNPVVAGDPTGRWEETTVDGVQIYRVQKDDWVSKLALKKYGDPHAWKGRLRPTDETLKKRGVTLEEFNYDLIYPGDTFVEVGAVENAERKKGLKASQKAKLCRMDAIQYLKGELEKKMKAKAKSIHALAGDLGQRPLTDKEKAAKNFEKWASGPPPEHPVDRAWGRIIEWEIKMQHEQELEKWRQQYAEMEEKMEHYEELEREVQKQLKSIQDQLDE